MSVLVIVESPNKVEKIQHLLGPGYEVVATAGHFRDLPDRELAIDLATFRPRYEVHDSKRALVARLQKRAAAAAQVLLATDADREGEAIAWHLAQVLSHSRISRVRFTEITGKALTAAVAAAGPIDQALVDAQQTRRILDRLVGYQISPLLRPFGPNHSAGRVQSAALHLVVEREKAREAFRAETFFTLAARYTKPLRAKYATRDDKGVLVETRVPTRVEADRIKLRVSAGPHTVQAVTEALVERQPKPPFTTSTLQQAASVVLDLRPGRTMALAQALFEAGLITYHRTDSVALSDEAIAMAREHIAAVRPDALPDEPHHFKSTASAQEAHEAIRPTQLAGPELDALAGDEAKLFDLIRRRFLACQCKPAVFNEIVVEVASADTLWRAAGHVVVQPAFLHFLRTDEDSETEAEPTPVLPAVVQGERLELHDISISEGSTKPPPRFTQAGLVRELERQGIGRPSTYASIVDDAGVLFERAYLAHEKKAIYPTPRGRLVDSLLAAGFADLVDAHYTASMESLLDEIAAGKRRGRDELQAWYPAFAQRLAAAGPLFADEAKKNPQLVEETSQAPKKTGKPCPLCGAELLLWQGKKGAFLACSGRPKCAYTADPSALPHNKPCPRCGKPLEEVEGRFGRYVRCPDRTCGFKEDLAKQVDEACPLCAAPMRDKGSFLSCSKYPTCRGSYDKKALAQAKKADKRCPKCGGFLIQKDGPKGPFLGCSKYPACRHLEALGPARTKRARSSATRSTKRA